MPGMLNGTDIFEFIVYRFNQCSFSQYNFICIRKILLFHIFAKFVDKVDSVIPKVTGKFLRDISSIAEEFAENIFGQFGNYFPVRSSTLALVR